MFTKTITSLVTAPITQNIALIRISGPQTYSIINQIFSHPLPLYSKNNHPRLIFGNIIEKNKQMVDQVLLLCFYKPHSFTGEDVVEISCHGNLVIVNHILQLILEKGSELAKEGEFTKQAFFNGKLNLTQANAINDLIRAPNREGIKLALHNLSTETQKELDNIENELLDLIATIKVNIDYPEEQDITYLTSQQVLPRLNSLFNQLKIIRASGQKVRVYQEGLKVVIVGKPNVGKSTLLNALLQEDKAIVSPLAGTTRDIIEARYNLYGIPLILLDTAGIHETTNIVEKIGVKRSWQAISKADIIFFLVDYSESWSITEDNIYHHIKSYPHLVVINKIDKQKKLQIPSLIPPTNIVQISAQQRNLNELEIKIKELFASNLINNLPSYPAFSQSWQQAKLKNLIHRLEIIIRELDQGIYLDAVCGDLEISYKLVQELSGKEYNNELLDLIFSKFCLGK